MPMKFIDKYLYNHFWVMEPVDYSGIKNFEKKLWFMLFSIYPIIFFSWFFIFLFLPKEGSVFLFNKVLNIPVFDFGITKKNFHILVEALPQREIIAMNKFIFRKLNFLSLYASTLINFCLILFLINITEIKIFEKKGRYNKFIFIFIAFIYIYLTASVRGIYYGPFYYFLEFIMYHGGLAAFFVLFFILCRNFICK
ncbi:MAG: hypothetical protein ABJN04_13370 [Hyphomicrobiales bacterium]